MDAVGQFFVELWGALAGFFQRDLGEVLRDCLDIGLVAVLIYWGLVIIRGTRAMQMAAGLVLLFVGYLVSSRLGLITIWTILDSLVTYFVLVVVVIFQADIRRALMRVGRGPLFRGQRTARETAVIEEVVKAATALAQKRIGGLVVFEREAELNEFIESGTVLDASVSKELLYSIFIPSFENPMHDGAVIIRDGRVWQAGAFLPLTGGSHDRTLGTRHRAALGISEETDAVVVVVSEERGATSLCFNGNIVRNLDGDSLRDALFGLFYRPQKAAAAAAPAAKKKKAAQKKKKKKKPAERTSLVPDDDEAALASAAAARSAEESHG
ncbi:MAG TPA: diadenylate cyclase CdaA [Polyangiaceae bacterium LLY-WYZ-15_(1-7)]|nr:TIGR00159 family protein [Myxococcales bacterium]MAT28086.1 TIGR00159 family protein [Sandaracinus sp.]HJL04025.1 diadenylate cyclase CdaA [Polyangiaceae bacterium LLY-WYZ-15_(1-7)]HJL10563.1 diadenylate cyclase CdaA [Polyangiaceae bacterium LLY-WYZ-15_(1-7)]HJL25743.1 diadenylate cyclase CdaA [Polyangiaceae bacterium LLY-WYZ-15_(1-7)]